ncbi:MAG: Hsp20/alpha crystallin family protein [Chloroflexota bacterium]
MKITMGSQSSKRSPSKNKNNQITHTHFRVVPSSQHWCPPTDIYETEDSVIVRVEIAGMSEAEFTISLDDDLLTIQGVRPDLPEERAYHQMEIRFGEFKSQVTLHWAIDPTGIDADYQDGFLRLVLPKAKPHRIEIGE